MLEPLIWFKIYSLLKLYWAPWATKSARTLQVVAYLKGHGDLVSWVIHHRIVGIFELLSKLLVSPLTTPVVVPYIIPL